jgi:hypothetical protein
MYSRPRVIDTNAMEGPSLKCLDCGKPHNRGCWWCLLCWEPITWAGVADRQSYLRDDRERIRVLSERYTLTMREFDVIMRTPGSAINTLPPWRVARERGAEPAIRSPWHTDTRPHKAAPPKQLALPAMVAIATARSVGAPAPYYSCNYTCT